MPNRGPSISPKRLDPAELSMRGGEADGESLAGVERPRRPSPAAKGRRGPRPAVVGESAELPTNHFSQAMAMALLAASRDALSACDLEGRFVIWGGAAERLYGYTAAEALGRSVDLILVEGEADAVWGAWRRARAGDAATVRCRHRSKDGRAVPVSMSLIPIGGESLEEPAIAVVARQASDSLAGDVAVKDAHARALEASLLKTEFITNMNHELRTPMNGVMGVCSLLAETPLNDEQREYVTALRASGDALMAVISKILDFSRLESSKLALVERPLSVRKLVQEACTIVGVGAAEKGISVGCSIDEEVPALLLGDGDRLRQVVLNLVDNAIKFTETGSVEISASWTEGETVGSGDLRLEVADTGIGIAPPAQQLIFRSFAQADGSSTRRYGGTGLGLTIAKELIELMDGEIGIRSALGEGSKFWFVVPMRTAPSTASATPMPSLDGARVIVADAHASTRVRIERQLRDWDASVRSTTDAAGLLRAVRTAALRAMPFDAAIVHADLPGMPAGELLSAIEADASLRSLALLMLVPDGGAPPASPRMRVIHMPLDETRLYLALAEAIGGETEEGDLPTRLQSQDKPASPRVLVAEDDESNRLVAVRQLERRGFQVDVARNGLQAVAMHAQTPYDAIFMDCALPRLDGYEAAREIRRREGAKRRTPIIAMTADAMHGDAQRCLAAGMDFYSSKPISPAGLDYVISQALNPER